MRKFLLVVLLLLPLAAVAADAPSEVSARVSEVLAKFDKGRKLPVTIGIYVAELDSGAVVYSRNGEEPLMPASNAKLLTTFAALKLLGGSYRFPTEIYVDRLLSEPLLHNERENGEVGNLYLRGYGDPSMVSERMLLLAQQVRAHGVTQVNDLVLDGSLFVKPPSSSGSEPYQAGGGALSVNHNSYAVTIAPTKKGQRAEVELLPGSGLSLINKVLVVGGNRYQIQISQNKNSMTVAGTVGEAHELQTEYRAVADPADYYAAMLKYSLGAVGIKVKGRIKFQAVPDRAKLLTTFQSRDLAEIVRDMNLFSNNFIAGQLMQTMGQDEKGYFNLTLGLERAEKVLEAAGISRGSFQLVDGSGLDRANRLSPAVLVKVLRAADADLNVGPDFFASLSRFGERGTLKTRKLPGGKPAVIWGKTGSLDGVSSIAGVYQDIRGRKRAFAIILNGGFSFDEGKQMEDQLLEVLLNSDEVVSG